jgi:hypothetical protein
MKWVGSDNSTKGGAEKEGRIMTDPAFLPTFNHKAWKE